MRQFLSRLGSGNRPALVALLLLAAVGILAAPSFATGGNLTNLLRQMAPLGILAIGQTLVLIAGGIDLSVGMLVGLVVPIGALVMAGSDGLILPAVLDIAPVLVPLAAVGVGLLMVGATTVHLRRREVGPAVLNLIFLAMAAFVAWGRFGPQSFTG